MKVYHLLFALLCISKNIFAQEAPLQFTVLTGNKDVSLGKITCITQDTWGYMWFLDQGNSQLVRYDGYRMKVFRYNPADTNSIRPTVFESFAADSSGNIWLPVRDGIDKINSATGGITHYTMKSSFGDAIIVDRTNNIWVGGQDGIYQFNPTTGKSVYYMHNDRDSTSIGGGVVRVLYEDKEGTIWAGNGYPFDQSNEGGLNKLDKATGRFTRYKNHPADPHSLAHDHVRALLEDSRGEFWVGTQGDGLQILNRKTGAFERLSYDAAHPEKLSRPPIQKGDTVDHITFIREDITGSIWIGTYHQGITRYDPATKKITRFKNDMYSAGSCSFHDSTTWTAFTSRDGTLWIATEYSNLLFHLDPFRKSIAYISTGNLANSIWEDKDGFLWMATEGNGVFKFDQQNNTIAHFKHNPADSSSLTSDHTMISGVPGTNKIWVGSFGGIRLVDGNNNKVYRVPGRDTLLKDNPQFGFVSTLEDRQGFTWIASWGVGLLKYNASDSSVKQFIPNPGDSFSISAVNLNHIIKDREGRLWMGGLNGVHKMDLKTERFENYLHGIFTSSVYQDSTNHIWVGSEKGLFKYDEKSDQFNPFFDSQTEMSTMAVGAIIEDEDHNLWMTSNSAMVKINPSNGIYALYGEKYGFGRNSMIPWSKSFRNSKGQILVGYEDGYSIFYPKELERKTNFKIYITDFMLDNILVLPGANAVIQKPVEETSQIELKYNQNNISFNFSAMDYRNPESISYSTMLEGYDNTWRNASDEKSSRYFGLPPGRFIYHVKAITDEGEYAEKNITVIISPPWWKTWWAYTLYAILIITGIWAFTRWRTKTLQKEKTVLEKRVMDRTQELKKEKEIVENTLSELKTTQAQLIQSEKMASLGELTAGIAHEIQNPLNFVNNFAEVNSELIDEMNQEADLKGIKALAISIKENNEKITFHGQRADAIVKDMLQHSKQSKGIRELTDINALCDEYLKLSYHGMRAKDISFKTNLKTDFDNTLDKIMIIPQDIGRVLLNLYNNAFYTVNEKARSSSAEYSPTVTVKTGKENGKVFIKVSDNGNGIPRTIIDKIFQPFFTTKPTGKGTGLGLSLSYDIVTKEHNGKMTVESREGEGSDFIVLLG
jgi:signal transduction histidine kinase/ligand-binding sensor domain-containing protein